MNAKKMFVSGVAVFLFGLAPALFADPSDAPAVPPKQDDNCPCVKRQETPPDTACPGIGAPCMRKEGQFGNRKGFGRMQQGQFGMQQGPFGMQRGQFGMQRGQFGMQQGQFGMQQGPFGHRNGFGGMHRRGGFSLIPFGPMSEDDMAKFADLGQKLGYALEDFRETNNEKTIAAVKNAVTALVEAKQQYEIDRCEKALARAKAKVQEKTSIVDRLTKRLTSPKADRHGRKGGHLRGIENERPMPQPQEEAPDKE